MVLGKYTVEDFFLDILVCNVVLTDLIILYYNSALF